MLFHTNYIFLEEKMFPRQLTERLISWSENPNRKPLVLRGARQVGKTSLAMLISNSFDRFINLNLDKKDNRDLFLKHTEVQSLFDAICLHLKIQPVKGSTLLFIDEIQNSPAAVQMLRYFYEEIPWLHVVAAGSLLESLIDKQISFPVGRIEFMPVRPCSFPEFLVALDEQQSYDLIQEVPFPEYAHDYLLKQFLLYMFIGGMPEAISIYRAEKSLALLNPVYESLIASYLDDIEKYARNQTMAKVIQHAIRNAFNAASTKITFQGFGESHYKNREMSEAFRTLEKAFLLQLVYPITSTERPATPNIRRAPRLQLLDTGLVNYMSGSQSEILNFQDLNQSFRGRIAEHITGQELLTLRDAVLFSLNYWTREDKNATAEVDFIWNSGNKIIPIEVKAGRAGKLRSLHQFIDRAPHSFAVRVYAGKFSMEEAKTIAGKKFTLMNLPFYLVNKLPEYLKLAGVT